MKRLKKIAFENALIDIDGVLTEGDPIAYYYTSYTYIISLQYYEEEFDNNRKSRGYLLINDNDQSIIKKIKSAKHPMNAQSIERWLIDYYGDGEEFGLFTGRDLFNKEAIAGNIWDNFEKVGFDLEAFLYNNPNKRKKKRKKDDIGSILDIIIEYQTINYEKVNSFVEKYEEHHEIIPITRQSNYINKMRVKLSVKPIQYSSKLIKRNIEAATWDDIINIVKNDQQNLNFKKDENGEPIIANVATYYPYQDNVNISFVATDKDESNNVYKFYAILPNLHIEVFNSFLEAEQYLLNNTQFIYKDRVIEEIGKALGFEDSSGNSQWVQYQTKNQSNYNQTTNQQDSSVLLITEFSIAIPLDGSIHPDDIISELEDLKDDGEIEDFDADLR